jgi:hypothetical protein
MSDFQARIASGTDLIPWEDPPTPDAPTRLNPTVQHTHKIRRHWHNVSMTVEAGIGVPPAWAPADGALGGRLFAWSWVATPQAGYVPGIPATPGFTSVVTFPALHLLVGHYELLCSRPDGGAVGISFEAAGF